MKFIKTLLFIAVIGLVTVSCKKEKPSAVVDGEETVEAVDSESSEVDAVESDATEVETEEEVVVVEETITSVETAPIYPECEGSNEEVLACLEKSLRKHVAKNFDGDLASDLDLSEGDHQIGVQFTIGSDGNVKNVKADAPNKGLENEAIRVIKLLPQMTPATKNGKNVSMTYTLPIEFDVN